MKKIIGMFPGNSSQREKMFCEQYEEAKTFRKYFDEASEYVENDLYALAQNVNKEMLSDIEINTPLIVAGGYASFQYFLEKYQTIPECLIGHSLGEFTAIAGAGIISLKDVLKLVVERARLAKKVKEKYNAGMCVINGLDTDMIEDRVISLRGNSVDVSISCYNTNSQICISGSERDLRHTLNTFSQEGAYNRMIEGNAPFHSILMEMVRFEFQDVLNQIEFNDPKIPVYSNWYGEIYTKENTKNILINHLVQPIHWNELVEKCVKQNPDYFVEFGSNGVLTGMVHKINSYVEVIDFDKKTIREQLYYAMNN